MLLECCQYNFINVAKQLSYGRFYDLLRTVVIMAMVRIPMYI